MTTTPILERAWNVLEEGKQYDLAKSRHSQGEGGGWRIVDRRGRAGNTPPHRVRAGCGKYEEQSMSNLIERAEEWVVAETIGSKLVGELLTIIRKLPQTADGVPFVFGSPYYTHVAGEVVGCGIVRMNEPEFPEGDYRFIVRTSAGGEYWKSASECWATPPAAEAARKETQT